MFFFLLCLVIILSRIVTELQRNYVCVVMSHQFYICEIVVVLPAHTVSFLRQVMKFTELRKKKKLFV